MTDAHRRLDLARAIEAEIRIRLVELAALERALETVQRAGAPGCDRGADGAAGPCGGLTHTAFCRGCGHVERRCDLHGGRKSVIQFSVWVCCHGGLVGRS